MRGRGEPWNVSNTNDTKVWNLRKSPTRFAQKFITFESPHHHLYKVPFVVVLESPIWFTQNARILEILQHDSYTAGIPGSVQRGSHKKGGSGNYPKWIAWNVDCWGISGIICTKGHDIGKSNSVWHKGGMRGINVICIRVIFQVKPQYDSHEVWFQGIPNVVHTKVCISASCDVITHKGVILESFQRDPPKG